MSRSYKRHPVAKDNDVHNEDKVIANRKYRRTNKNVSEDEVGYKNMDYKKTYPKYDIHDFISRWPEEDARRWCQELWDADERIRQCFGTFENCFHHYWKDCHNK